MAISPQKVAILDMKNGGDMWRFLIGEVAISTLNFLEALVKSKHIFISIFQVPGRMGLLITLYLITFNVYGSISSTLAPSKRGFSYIEAWMVGVVITISVAILEYFFILAIKRRNKYANLDYVIEMIDFISLIINLAFFSSFVIFYWMKGFGIF